MGNPKDTSDYLMRELLADEEDEHLAYEQLVAYVDRTLPAAERQAVEDHAAVCRSCRADVTSLSHIAANLSRRSPVTVPVSPIEGEYRPDLPAPIRRRRPLGSLLNLLAAQPREPALRRQSRYAWSLAAAAAAAAALFILYGRPQDGTTAGDSGRPPQIDAQGGAAARNVQPPGEQERREPKSSPAAPEPQSEQQARLVSAARAAAQRQQQEVQRALDQARQARTGQLAKQPEQIVNNPSARRARATPEAAATQAESKAAPVKPRATVAPAVSGPAPPPSPAPPTEESSVTAVQAVLVQYRAALESRDIGALKRIWPALSKSQEDALLTEFQQARAIVVALESVDIRPTNDGATVTCRRIYSVTTADGLTFRTATTMYVTLTRRDGVWRIDTIRHEAAR